jgi:threonine dehydrogenase-like Zn-dependent dehydrogenase
LRKRNKSFEIAKLQLVSLNAKNLTINMGNCNYRKYIPKLLEMVCCDEIAPQKILTQVEPMVSAIDVYKAFDRRQAGWMKVELVPSM